jgi:hypothetical protein
LHYNAPARHAQAQTRAQRGIRADERLRRTPYRGFLRERATISCGLSAFFRAISVIAMFQQLRRLPTLGLLPVCRK